MQILVTGGAGYIGSQTCKELYQSGFEPICVDNLSTGNISAVKWGPIEIGDIRNSEFLDYVFRKYSINAVIHFAASAYVGESHSDPILYFSNNIHGTCNLIESMIRNKVHKIIFSSSCATFGESETGLIHENSFQNPINTYGFTKLASEKLIINLGEIGELNYAILRYFNAAGADPDLDLGEMHFPETHIIPLALDALIGNKVFTINGSDFDTLDGTAIRDYIHVKDLAQAHISALKKLIDSHNSFQVNLGSGVGTSILDIVKYLETLNPSFRYKFAQRRIGDPGILIADNDFAAKYLSWSPENSNIANIIESALKWECHRRKMTGNK